MLVKITHRAYSLPLTEDMPLAGDADFFSGVALTRGRDLITLRSSQGTEAQHGPNRSANSDLQAGGADECSDEALVSRVCSNHENALDILFCRYSRLVFSIALHILRDAGEAEEVVQECFLYVLRKAPSFEPSRGSAKIWIEQVAYSRALDRKAHLQRRGFYLRSGLDPGELATARAPGEDAEQEMGHRLDFDRLLGAFGELTEMQRTTLQLFYFEQLDLREISLRLRQPLGNVRHHFYRGLERLRRSAIVEELRDCRRGRQ